MSLKDFNRRVPWPLRALLVVGCGFLFYWTALTQVSVAVVAATIKLRGRAPACEWARVLSFYGDASRLQQLETQALGAVSVRDRDDKLGLTLVSSPKRDFWIRWAGETRSGPQLVGYLLAEHDWMVETNPGRSVRRGDVVLDCGAHVGVFTHKALELGASKVVAIEPDPVNLECLRRNFAAEITSGRVVVVPKGVWSTEKTLTLFLASENSGMNSMVERKGNASVEVPVTTVDKLVRELNLPAVDFIKMDIEGAEREALQGALETLRRFRPRLMLDTYHRPDDPQVIPAIIARADARYAMTCGPCESDGGSGHLVPHVTFYQ